MSWLPPLRRPNVGHPIDLPERLLADLAHLFHVEAEAHYERAIVAYTRESWEQGAKLEIAADGLEFDSREIAEIGLVKRRIRISDADRQRMPWERSTPDHLPWEP